MVTDFKDAGKTFFVVKRAGSATFNLQEINYEGIYLLDPNNKEFVNQRNHNMKMRINTETSSFELSMSNLGTEPQKI